MDPSASALLEEFLSVAIHLILYTRQVYAPEIFERRRFLDVTVFRSRHVELNDHIALVADGARALLERGEADKLVLTIFGAPREGGPRATLERFLFELRRHDQAAIAVDMEALRTQLRGFLLKLHACDALLSPLPEDVDLTFACELHTAPTRSLEPLPVALLERWTECDTQQQPGHSMGTCAGVGAPSAGGAPTGAPLGSSACRGGGSSNTSSIGSMVPLKSLSVSGLTLALSVVH